MRCDLLTVFIPQNEGDRIASALKGAGADGCSITRGRSWSENALLQLFGFGDKIRDIVFCAATDDKFLQLKNAVIKEAESEKKGYGFLFSINITHIYRAGTISEYPACMAEDKGMGDKTHEVITAILNKGFADDVMAAARSAGAGGGTVLHGRGTALPEDASFFGITLVPEKEVLMIVTEKEKTNAILKAINALPFLAQPGSGIAFCMEAEGFASLGQTEC